MTAASGRGRSRTGPGPGEVDLVVFDFDGVMTDNAVWVAPDGTELVRCDRSDGLGVSRLLGTGIGALVLSTEGHPVVAARCAKLGLECLQGVDDKAARLAALLEERGINRERTAYVGNDVNDLGCLALVGWPIAVADAHPEVLGVARVVLQRRGGHGAVRELCDALSGA